MTSAPPLPPAVAPLSRRSLGLVVVLTLVLAAALLWRPVQLNGDFTTSYLTWQEWRGGAPFHSISAPDPTDISRDRHQFLSWWSPGTYLGPALIESAGVSLGGAIGVWLAAAGSAGFIGWRRLLLRFGFSDLVTALTLLLMLLSWHTLYPFRIYHGGEATLFALFPWLMLAVLACPAGSWVGLPAVAAITFLGAYAKLSFLITALALAAVLGWRARADKPPALTAVRRFLPVLLGYGAGAALIWLLILSKGGNPGTAGLTPADERLGPVAAVTTAVTLPVKALFALTSMTSRLDQVFGWSEVSARPMWLALCLVLAGPLYWMVWRHAPGALYRQALLLVGGLTAASLAWLYLRHTAISDEDRHARLVALLLLPGLIAAALSATRGVRLALALLLVAAAGWGVLSIAHHWSGGGRRGATGARGVTYWDLQSADLRAVHAVDGALAGQTALWLTTVEELALELPARRVRTAEPLLAAAREHRVLRGNAGHLLILVPAGPVAEAIAAALPAFAGHQPADWRRFSTGTHQLFYHGAAALPLTALP